MSDLINEEYCITMLRCVMDVSQLMIYDEQLEGKKLRNKRMGESKMDRFKLGFQGAKVIVFNKAINSKVKGHQIL